MTATAPELVTNNDIDFGFAALELENKTARFEMPWVSPGAFMEVRPATSENTAYNAASLRMSGKRQRAIAASGTLTSENANQDRQEDRVLYPKYVAVGWGGIFNKKTGEAIKFEQDVLREWFAKCPAWIFDRMRIFCMRPERFLDQDDLAEVTEPNPVEVAGN